MPPHSQPGGVTTGVEAQCRTGPVGRWTCRSGPRLGREVTLRRGTAHVLPFADALFDTVVCPFGLRAIPDHGAAVDEWCVSCVPAGG